MTAKQFSDLVRQSKLVDEDYLNALLQAFQQRRSETDVDARVVAKLLVQAKLLSPWQADQLLPRDDRHDPPLGRCRGRAVHVCGENPKGKQRTEECGHIEQ